MKVWELVWHSTRFLEPSHAVINYIAKARDEKYQGFLMQLLAKADLPFYFHNPIHSYLYMHGIVDNEIIQDIDGKVRSMCRFSSPFVQSCLYDALSQTLAGETYHDHSGVSSASFEPNARG